MKGGCGIFLGGGGMSNFLAGRGRIPVAKTLISTLVCDFFNFKATDIPCLSY